VITGRRPWKSVDQPQNIEGKLHRSLFQLVALDAHRAGAIARAMPTSSLSPNPQQSTNQISK
jgi:hypothetical protein